MSEIKQLNRLCTQILRILLVKFLDTMKVEDLSKKSAAYRDLRLSAQVKICGHLAQFGLEYYFD